jgi:parallel beta-helix repeat protein
MWKSVFVGVGLFSLITFGHAYGTTYYTAKTGSDSNSCSQATSPSTPKLTINAGILCLQPGDTLDIRGGTYVEKLNAFEGTTFPTGTSWSKPVTIQGHSGEVVVVRPGAHTILMDIYDGGAYTDSSYRQYLIFDNLIFDGTNGTSSVIKFDIGSRRIRIQNSKIIGNSGSNGLSWGGDSNFPLIQSIENEILNVEITGNAGYGMYVAGSSNLIDGNYIHDNSGYGVHIYSSGHNGINNNTIRNNRIVHNGYNNSNPVGSCALLLSSGDNNIAYNNLVLDHNGCGIQIYRGTTNAQAYNNTIVGNATECIYNQSASSGSIIRNNICYNNGRDITNDGSGAIIDHNTTNAINPQFANAASADFRLQSNSSMIDAGLIISIVTTDIARISRPQAKGYDIGAYEYVGSQLPTPSKLRVISTQQ